MSKVQGLRVPSVAAQQQAHIDQLMNQAQRLKAEVSRLEGERDAARKAARAWKRAARIHRKRHKEAARQIAYMSRRHAETGE